MVRRMGLRAGSALVVSVLAAGLLVVGASSARAASATAIAASHGYTCALTTEGGVFCWGYRSTIPEPVSGLSSGVAAISGGPYQTCAVTGGGGVACWDREDPTPVAVVGLSSGVVSVAAGYSISCALSDAGGVKCWGATPTDVPGLTAGVVAITTGWSHACALTDVGGVTCWGSNRSGQLGDGTGVDSSTPVDVVGLTSGVTAIGAGESHTCAVTTGGGVKCWGANYSGEVGAETNGDYAYSPVDVVGLTSGVTGVAGGAYHTCAVTTTGGVLCWGGNRQGQLGDGTRVSRFKPAPVRHLSASVVTTALRVHSCALTTVGGVKCWGPNRLWQLGDASGWRRLAPIGVLGFPGDPGGVYRPDLEIGTSKGGSFVGDRVYNTTGEEQTRSATVAPGDAVVFFVHLRNRAAVTDSIFLSGTRREWNFTAHYFHGEQEITDAVTGVPPQRRGYPSYVTDMGPKGSIGLRIKVWVRPGTEMGSERVILLRATSGGGSRKVDVVRAIVTVGAA